MKLSKLLVLLLLLPALAMAGNDLVRRKSHHDVQETMDRLEQLVKNKGLTVFARVDHKKNAESVGMKMPASQVLIFGNPRLGTRIMLRDTAIGVDLPLRILVYADYDGNTWVLYHNPQGLTDSYDNLEDCTALDKVEKALDKLTRKAAD